MFKRDMPRLIETRSELNFCACNLIYRPKNQKMVLRYFILSLFLLTLMPSEGQELSSMETNLAGVFQNKTLFIQNPYNRNTREFCIEEVRINGRKVETNYNLSALKLDFDGFDPYTPVKIKVLHKDSVCNPIIINPDAILFHTIFRFSEVSLTDSTFRWYTKGERGVGDFEVEKLSNGFWVDQEVIQAGGRYEGQEYVHYPSLDEGSNKYRIRYNFPRGSRVTHLYSQEIEYEFYPEPVEFKPKSAKTRLYLSRATHFEIYDKGQNLVLEGQGNEIDVRVLRRGEYIIYFDGRFPGVFTKE